MDEAHARHDDSPEYYRRSKEYAGRPTFQQDVGQGLEQSIGDEEDGQCGIVLWATHVQVLEEGNINLCVANVGSVEKGNQIEEGELLE